MSKFGIRPRSIPTFLALFGVGFWAGTRLKYAQVAKQYAERSAQQESTTGQISTGLGQGQGQSQGQGKSQDGQSQSQSQKKIESQQSVKSSPPQQLQGNNKAA